MAPTRTNNRLSSHASPSPQPNRQTTVPTKSGGTPTRTPHNMSPIKKRKPGLTISQKQALIDNLQLEITERARRLRAQYNLQAQGLRSRIEIRVNRIPISLRKMTMGDLLARYERDGDKRVPTTEALARPPVPAKDPLPSRFSPQKPAFASPYKQPVYYKGSSDELAGPDKENDRNIENPKKRTRAPNVPSQVLSPASSNSRLVPARERERPASPAKSLIARPASPSKPAPQRTGILAGMVERAKATRAGVTRKTTASSNTSSATSAAAPPPRPQSRAKKVVAAAGTGASRTTTSRAARRVSASSSASTETTSTVVRKTTRAPVAKKTTTAAAARKTAGGTAAAKKAAATKTEAPATRTTTRVLRSKK
ncbi:uncharacterized protein DNG_00211 [Cephalotrichum gorgonifer]|uniref:Borealin N-terminal domain-containing protein n=1 Tax=Cephalotrichum gorgonifer TaxID=2041049 RepID=A0AAE8SQN5_9PEZI|nr:uncharacterized protein DNG_00211 [Cephalotrichum gorgonifer]